MDKPDTRPPKNMTGKTVDGVRPGGRHKFRKATNSEKADRVEWLANKLVQNSKLSFENMESMMENQFGIHKRQSAEYIAWAKQLIADRLNMDKQQLGEYLKFNLTKQVETGKGSVPVAAMRLMAEIEEIMPEKKTYFGGIEGGAPIKIETTDTTPAPKLTNERLMELLALRHTQPLLSTNGNGHSNGNGHALSNGHKNGHSLNGHTTNGDSSTDRA